MSYIISNTDPSPFCTVTISGTNTIPASSGWLSTTAFDTTNQNWAVFSGSTYAISTSVDTLAFSIFSPNSNLYGILYFRDNPNTSRVLGGYILPESTTGSAGSKGRGDDQCILVSDSHKPQYNVILSASENPDKARSIMIMQTIGA